MIPPVSSGSRVRSWGVLPAVVAVTLLLCSSALAAAVDDLGTRALGVGPGSSKTYGWPRLVARAHAQAPSLKIFWPHPDHNAGGYDYVGLERAESDFIADEPEAESYRCASGIKNFNVLYHTKAYDTNPSSAAGSFNVIVENATPVPCAFFFDRVGLMTPYAAGIFTATSTVTIHLSRRMNGRNVAYTAPATLSTDTVGKGELAGLADCILTMRLSGTSIAILVNASGSRSASSNCAEAELFASRMHRLTYTSH